MSLPRPTAAIRAVLMTAVALPFAAAPVLAPTAAGADPARTGPVSTAPVSTGAASTGTAGLVAAQDEEERTPLTVRLRGMTPAVVPQRGPIVLTGTVTNDSEETWQSVNVLPFIGTAPFTDRTAVAEQAATEESAEVAERLTHPEMFVSIGDLEPGQTRTFRIRMPRRLLPISGLPGVYWIGAHALGTSTDGRDSFADGRVRTFIPLLPGGDEAGADQPGTTPVRPPRTTVSLVVPLREEFLRTSDGRVADPEPWATRLAENGRLGRLLGLAESAGAQPFTWLIDPADLDAIADLAADNPPMSLGEARPEPTEESPGPEPDEATPGDAAGAAGEEGRLGAGSAGAAVPAPPLAEVADDWLQRLLESTSEQAVLGLAYADPDVAALARNRPAMLDKARRLAERRFAARDVSASSAVAPPDGWLDEDAVAAVEAETVLLSDHGEPQSRTRWSTGTGSGLVLGDALVLQGGPSPGDPLDALALRQRILADAALRALDGIESPLPVVLPAGWDPGPGWRSADFFAGLDQPWLDLATVSGPTADLPTYPRPLPYPERVREREVPRENIRAAGTMINLGALFDELLETTNDVYQQLVGAGLTAVSHHARDDALAARQRVLAHAATLEEDLEEVQVQLGTDFVTLSGGEGVLTVSLVNELAQPVTVGVTAYTEDPGVTITAPPPVRIGPDERVAVRLQAEATSIGVHEVTLSPVTDGGRAVGEPVSFNLRTSQVGRLIWFILVGVGALLLVAIVLRIVHRVRSHRWRK